MERFYREKFGSNLGESSGPSGAAAELSVVKEVKSKKKDEDSGYFYSYGENGVWRFSLAAAKRRER